MNDHKDSLAFTCRHCEQTIIVAGIPRTERAGRTTYIQTALRRVDWSAVGGHVGCRQHPVRRDRPGGQ